MNVLTSSEVERVLATIPQRRIGLIGDLFLDRYLDIEPARDEPSVETGLTAYQVVSVRNYPGALGTVLNNLVALGVGHIHPITFVGEDGEGADLIRELRRRPGVIVDDAIVSAERMTPTYTKPMYGSRELNRLDIKNRTPTPVLLQQGLIERVTRAWHSLDAVIVLDQVSEAECGVVTSQVRQHILELAIQSPEKFVLADSRERIAEFRGLCVKPNEREGSTLGRWDRAVFRTLGERGLEVISPRGETQRIAGYPVSGPTDICGAGDSCSAGITCGKACGLSDAAAAALGNLVASVTVQQIGVTGTCTPAQLRARWAEVTSTSSS